MENVASVYPLSPTQEGMLFHSITGPDYYIRQATFDIAGELVSEALKAAWQGVVDRQAVLRTSFLWDGLKQPIQVVHRAASPEWNEFDWRHLPASERAEQLTRFLAADRDRGLDLQRAPLLRCTLIRTGAELSHFVVTFHHIVLDGWSIPLLLEEVKSRYGLLRRGSKQPFEPAPAYRDYISWLKRQNQGGAEAFWKRYLQGVAGPTRLALEPAGQAWQQSTPEYGEVRRSAGSRLSIDLREAARLHHVTTNTLIQGAWAALLSRRTGQTDVLFGAVVSGRPHDLPRVEEIAGLFINTLPVRVQVDFEPSVKQYLQHLQRDQVEARQFEYASLPDIRRWIGLNGHSELFESILVFENYRGSDSYAKHNGDLRMSLASSFERTHYPLTLMVAPSSDFEFSLAYQKGRIDDELAERLLVEFTTLLDGLAKNPDATVGALPLLTRSEQNEILERTNNTKVELPANASLPVLFERQARETPHAIAAQFERQTIAYEKLRIRTNQLARYLRQLGMGTDALVAVCLEPSLDLLVALLAIAKSGAAYVPLDPEYPSDRIEQMLADSGAGVLVTDGKLATALPCGHLKIVRIDTDSAAINTCSDESLDITIGADDLAYVIYTSGSTGRPKGVMVRHISLANLLLSMLRRPGLAPQDRLLAVTTPCFDIAALELFLPLIAGARVVIAPRDVTRNPDLLAAAIEENGITSMQATPATWQMLLQHGWKGRTGLKILSGGEPLSRDLANALLDRAGSLWNMYGPTETTVWSTVSEIGRGDQVITIGSPIANTTTYVVDENMQPVPLGVAGELYIGGAGLARGYHNRPELTREKFVPNPFGDAGSRLYRTGDVARFRADFSIECLGRTDHQVKIRGFRIELGEIEIALRRHSAVSEAVVVGHAAGSAEARLAAYLVLSNGIVPGKSELRNHLRKTLPDYMVPSSFTLLEALPLTPNGKIDRKALPAPDCDSSLPVTALEEPANDTEKQLVDLFRRFLAAPNIGVCDKFFDIGGHSLLAVRLMSEIEKLFNLNLPLATLFEASSARELAAIVSDRRRKLAWTSLVRLKPSGTAAPLFCVHSLGANLVSYRHLAQRMDPDQPVYGLQPLGLDGQDEVHQTVEEMAAHYLKEIRKVQPHGPYNLSGVCLGGIVAFEMAQQLRTEGEETSLLALIDSYYAPQPRHLTKLPEHITPVHYADYYLGEVLLRHGRERLLYIATRISNIFRRSGRAIKRALGLKTSGTGSLTRALQQIHEVHSAAERSYIPKTYLGRVTLFWCGNYPVRSYYDTRLGWCDVAAGGLEVHMIPGDHMSMLEPANAEVLAEKLTSCLRRASGASATETSALRA